MKRKIIVHVIALINFIFGLIVIHVLLNGYLTLFFFGISLNRAFVIDMAILCMGIGFFIEFSLTFKPIKIIEK